jgi:acetyl esterase/lipase
VGRLVRFHDGYWGDEAAMAEGSPQRIVAEGGWQALPPVLVIQGTADRNMPPGGLAEPFADAYRRAGGSVRLELFEGQPHGFVKPETDPEVNARALAAMKAFIYEQIGPAPGAGEPAATHAAF